MVTRPRLWLKTTSEKGPHLSCVVFTLLGRAPSAQENFNVLIATLGILAVPSIPSHFVWTYYDDLESLAGPLTFRHPTSTSGQTHFPFLCGLAVLHYIEMKNV